MSDYWIGQLRKQIRSGNRPLIICGSGTSIQASAGSAPSWLGLLHNGVDLVEMRDSPAGWPEWARQRLSSKILDRILDVGDEITDFLGGQENPEFRGWIESNTANIKIESNELLAAIFSLGCPVATTNYDSVLSKFSDKTPILWNDYNSAVRFIKEDLDGILHLHGHWSNSQSIILGKKSYNNIVSDKKASLVNFLSTITRPVIFVGCGADGLSDPDFQEIEKTLESWLPSSERRFWLVRKDFPAPDKDLKSARLFLIPYGESFEELPKFLTSVLSNDQKPVARNDTAFGEFKTVDLHEPCPHIYGRDVEVGIVVDAILHSRPCMIAGGPGMGKTALALNSIYNPSIVEQFGDRRCFLSVESSIDSRDVFRVCCETFGLDTSGSDAALLTRIKRFVFETPAVVVFDNAEGLVDADRLGTEKSLQLLAQVSNLSIVVTCRGVPPGIPGAVVVEDLPKLGEAAAQETFLDAAGGALRSDPDLRGLLSVLDGHALALKIVGGQAAGLIALKGLAEMWESARAEILRKPGAEEGRLTSVRASVALSVQGALLRDNPKAKRLLAVLSMLPAGLREEDVRSVLGGIGVVKKHEVSLSIGVLQQLRLVERRLDQRLRLLTPVRETIRLDVPPLPSDRQRVLQHFLRLAEKGETIGTTLWPKNSELYNQEADNIDAICLEAVVSGHSQDKIGDSLLGFAEFAIMSGRPIPQSSETAWEKWRCTKRNECTAVLGRKLGTLEIARHDYEAGRFYLESSLAIARETKDHQTAANSLHALGSLDIYTNNYDRARKYFDESMAIYARKKDDLGYANALYGHARIEVSMSDSVVAEGRLEEILAAYKRRGAIGSEANVLLLQSDICLQRLDIDGAVKALANAVQLYTDSGNALGVESCQHKAAVVAMTRRDDRAAEDAFLLLKEKYKEEGSGDYESSVLFSLARISLRNKKNSDSYNYICRALSLLEGSFDRARYGGSMFWRGVSLISLGDLLRGKKDAEAGFEIFEAASPPSDRALPGWRALRAAVLSTSREEADAHWGRARDLWLEVGRPDLVEEWVVDLRSA